MKEDFRVNINPFEGCPFPEKTKTELFEFLNKDLDVLNSCKSFSISILNIRADVVCMEVEEKTIEDLKRLIQHQQTGVEYIVNLFSKNNEHHLIQSTCFKFLLIEEKEPF